MIHPLVRDLYKRILFVGRDYPLGLDYVRKEAKKYILMNSDIRDDRKLRQAVHFGRNQVKEMIGVIQLKKYRHLKASYTDSNEEEDKVDLELKDNSQTKI